jgi:hypothetical protein
MMGDLTTDNNMDTHIPIGKCVHLLRCRLLCPTEPTIMYQTAGLQCQAMIHEGYALIVETLYINMTSTPATALKTVCEFNVSAHINILSLLLTTKLISQTKRSESPKANTQPTLANIYR